MINIAKPIMIVSDGEAMYILYLFAKHVLEVLSYTKHVPSHFLVGLMFMLDHMGTAALLFYWRLMILQILRRAWIVSIERL